MVLFNAVKSCSVSVQAAASLACEVRLGLYVTGSRL